MYINTTAQFGEQEIKTAIREHAARQGIHLLDHEITLTVQTFTHRHQVSAIGIVRPAWYPVAEHDCLVIDDTDPVATEVAFKIAEAREKRYVVRDGTVWGLDGQPVCTIEESGLGWD